ncbi:MAG: alpha/beta fold hydrolase [Rubrivivax sp.]
MPTLQRPGCTLHYEVSGEGPAIVFTHSYLCDGRLFAHQVASLQRRWRVINVDLRGHGRSSAAVEPLDFHQFADDVLAVLDAEGVASAVWAGLSMGGFTALRAALKAPQRVSALVLMDTSARRDAPHKLLQHLLMRGLVRAFGPRAVAGEIEKMMFGATTRRTQPALVSAWREQFLQCHVPSALAVARALSARDDLRPRLGEIRCPTLVVVGAEDQALPPDHARELAAGIRGAQLVEVPGAGHLSTMEAPAVLTRCIEDFVEPLQQRLRQAA